MVAMSSMCTVLSVIFFVCAYIRLQIVTRIKLYVAVGETFQIAVDAAGGRRCLLGI